jgi:hypothetical protein
MFRTFKMLAAATVVTVGSAAAASAQSVLLGATLSGAQEVPAVTTPATGTSTLLYNQGTGAFTVTLSFSGLTGNTVPVGPGNAPAHIHLGGPGVNGPIAIPLVGIPAGGTSFTNYTRTFTFAELLTIGVSDANVAALQATLNGLVGASVGTTAGLYANVHTTTFPGGEIRGNMAVIPEPSTYALLASGLAGLGVVARRRRQRA